MNKKRVDQCSLRSKAGQVTVFMIVGLILLFVFIFIILVSKSIQLGQLEEGKEGVLSKAFQKEGLRIYVEDCLRDSLTQGLLLVGQQGRLWSDQPGGRKRFEQGLTGIYITDGVRVFYALTNETYNQHTDQSYYPCSDGQRGVCSYQFPNTTIGFGTVEWLSSTIAGDLERYLIEETVVCVERQVRSNISQHIKVEASQDINLDLSLENDLILVKAYYPLKLVLGDEELFSLTNFDFSYSSKFKQLLETAISFPLQQDQQFIDFNFEEATLLENTFNYGCESSLSPTSICTRNIPSQQYRELSLKMERKSWPETGDTIIEFTVPEGVILETPGEYTFRFARQNRPPALDYISQCPGDDYDYLLLKGVAGNLGTLNFTLIAADPDEENSILRTESLDLNDDDLSDGSHFVVTNTNSLISREAPYIVTAIAEDSHQLTDWQHVRIKIQDQMSPMLEFINLADKSTTLSLEDPVCLVIINGLPNLQFSVNGLNPPVTDRSLCAPLVSFNVLTHDNNNLLVGQNNFRITGPSQSFGQGAECSYTLDITQTATVQECTPVTNTSYPYPYFDSPNPKLNTFYQFDTAGNRDDTLNPFQATRACCAADGTVLAGSCTIQKDLGCFTDEFYLERVSGSCTGRGNVCSKPVTAPFTPGINTCGDKSKPFCNDKIEDKCQNQEAWGFREGVGWCYGNTNTESGCNNFCKFPSGSLDTSAIVDIIGVTQNPDPNQANLKYSGTYDSQFFACGCSTRKDSPCDANYDGIFNGVCDGDFRITCEGDSP